MARGLLGKKVGMTQLFGEEGHCIAVTLISAGPCPILGVPTPKRGSRALPKAGSGVLQLGFDPRRARRGERARLGPFKKLGLSPVRFVKEVDAEADRAYQPGDTVTVGIFAPGDRVDVTGVSIGKGFQGGVKRWHWRGGPKTHGSTSHRAPGSIGSSSDPSRVFKGHHLPGRMGGARVTTRNLEVVGVRSQEHLLIVKGAIPGHRNSYCVIRKSRSAPAKGPGPRTLAREPA